MNICISFPIRSFENASDAFRFIVQFTRFNKEGILSAEEDKDFISYDFEYIINYLNNDREAFTLVSNFSKYLEFENSITFRRDIKDNLNIFYINVKSILNLDLEGLLQSSNEKLFTMCILYDMAKSRWQNEQYVINFKTFKKPYEHLDRIFEPKFGPLRGDLIDISKNPGHLKEVYSTVLMAAPEMWFGSGVWDFFDKQKILSFPRAKKIQEIMSNIIYVNLFDWEESDYEIDKILSLQKEFRIWSGMDEVEELLAKKSKELVDATNCNLFLSDLDKEKNKQRILDLVRGKKR